MSGDESTSTRISAFSNLTENQLKVKTHKSEEWEIDLVGRFLLDLYHRSYINAKHDWCAKKSELREKFSQFITDDLRKKLKELNGTDNVGTLLDRCGFIMNTMRGSPLYKIRCKALFDFRNNKMKELDGFRINNDSFKEDIIYIKGFNNKLQDSTDVLDEDNFDIDECEPKITLEYQGTTIQRRVKNFWPSNTSCFVCQEDFSSMDTFEDHIQIHGEDTDFEFSSKLEKFGAPIFTVNYALCKDSHFFCFEFKTSLEKLIIEKIIIVQSRSFFYVHNMRVPYNCPESGVDRFFVDSHLFRRHVEQPIILICHLENVADSRVVEEHHFMRSEEFPKVNLPINSNRLPNKILFKPKFELADYFPPKEIQDALKDEFYHKQLMTTSNEFRDYVRNEKKLQPQTIAASLNILLQIEDMDTIQQYLSLKQQNIKLRCFSNLYSFQRKPKQRIFLENIISAYDELILTSRTDIYTNNEEIMKLMLQNKSDIKRMKNTFVGLIENVDTGRISFKCDQKININASYTVIFRPSRLNFRYQYRSLQLLSVNMDFLMKFLFPTKISYMPLSCKSLTLYNENINNEQLQAVRNIAEGARTDATYILFGPPGTGKTSTLVESILQLLKNPGSKILVTASSNSACDEIALRLCKFLKALDIQRAMVRIYSRASEVRAEGIPDELLENSNMYNGHFYPDIGILHEYRVVVCTLSIVAKLATGKFGRNNNGGTLYTHLFIDEVAASTELEALMAITTILSSNSCLIISGDHKQLGPILQSKRAKELGLDASLMDRLLSRDCYRVDVDTGDYDRTIQTRLVRNYRSHPAIVNLFSSLYYNHSLEPCAKRDDVSLCEIWHKSRNREYPISFHAIYEPSKSDKQSHSLYNLGELQVVMDYVKDLMYFGINGEPVQENDIGIISPYKKQYKRIQEELNLRKFFGIETGSVETFQGKEKDIIIVSFVRSGTENLGFLDSPRRLNVTISRPKSLLILIGNPTTLSLNEEFEYIIRECRKNNTFVGATSAPRSDVRVQSTSNDVKTIEMLQLGKKMQSLNISNSDQLKVGEISKKPRRKRRFGRKNSRSTSNQTLNERSDVDKDWKNRNDEDSDDDESSGNDQHNTRNKHSVNSKHTKGICKDAENNDSENDKDDDDDESGDNGNDKPATSSLGAKTKSKNAKKGYGMRQSKNCGKISKQHGGGRQKNIVDNNININKNKLDSIFNELPQVPTIFKQTTPIYTRDQLAQLQHQQQYYYNFHRNQHEHNSNNNNCSNLQTEYSTIRQPPFNPYMMNQQPLFNSDQHQQQFNYVPPISSSYTPMASNNGTLSFFKNNTTNNSPLLLLENRNASKNTLCGSNVNIKSTKRNGRTNATGVNRSKGTNDGNSLNSVSSNKRNVSGQNNNTKLSRSNDEPKTTEVDKGKNKYSKASNSNVNSKSESIVKPIQTIVFENTANSIEIVNKSQGQQKNQYNIGAVNKDSKENGANISGNFSPHRHDVGQMRSSSLALTLPSTSTDVKNFSSSSTIVNAKSTITSKHRDNISLYPVLDSFGRLSTPTGNNVKSSAIDAVRPSTSTAINNSYIYNHPLSCTKSDAYINSSAQINSNFSTNTSTSCNSSAVGSSTGNTSYSGRTAGSFQNAYEATEGVSRPVRNLNNTRKKKDDSCSIS